MRGLLLFVLLSGAAFASPVGPLPQCVSDDLAAYQLLGSGGCQIGFFRFNNFGFSDLGPTPVPGDEITVDPDLTPGQMTLRFASPAFSVTGAERKQFSISYIVDPPPIIFRFSDDMETLTPVAPGRADVFTEVCANALGEPPCPPGVIVNLHVFHAGTTSDTFAEALLPLSNYLEVENRFDLQANGASADFTALENQISYIPEPSAMAPVAAALLAFGALARRRRTHE